MRSYVTFDGRALTDYFTVAEVSRSPSSTTSNKKTVAGRNGVVVTDSARSSVTISMTVVCQGADPARRRDAMRKLRAWLDCDGPRPLAFSDDGGLYYLAMPQDIAESSYVGATAWKVTFLVADPVQYSPEVHAASGQGQLSFHVGGTAETRPVVTLSSVSPSSGFVAVALDGSQVMKVPLSQSTSSIVIDCANDARTVLVNGAPSMITTDSDWWVLGPGLHEASVTTGSATLEVEWRDRWVV